MSNFTGMQTEKSDFTGMPVPTTALCERKIRVREWTTSRWKMLIEDNASDERINDECSLLCFLF
jgi:hypothetical protein